MQDQIAKIIAHLLRQNILNRLANVHHAQTGKFVLRNDSFDMAICALGLMYVPDPRKALAEMARAMAVKRFDEDVMEQVRDEFLASVAQYLSADGSYSIPGEFVTVSATVS